MRGFLTRLALALLISAAWHGAARAGEAVGRASGTVRFECADCEAELPRRFQLGPHSFSFEETPLPTSSRTLRISRVTFPSPVVTPHSNNNTVHCEYFCPNVRASQSAGKIPGVIVLHILGGDFDLSRLFCRALASRGVAALFLKMPYYGERRQPGSSARMVSIDPQETVRGMTQAVLDVRQGAAWLAAQEVIDSDQLGIMGISLGGITAALAAGVEPRFSKACLILAGGDMGQVAWTSAELAPLRERWLASGRTKEELLDVLRPVDPVQYAKPLRGRKILMLNAKNDEVVPRQCTEALWRAFGEPPIIWWDAGHYSAARYLFDGVGEAVRFFQPERGADSQSTAK